MTRFVIEEKPTHCFNDALLKILTRVPGLNLGSGLFSQSFLLRKQKKKPKENTVYLGLLKKTCKQPINSNREIQLNCALYFFTKFCNLGIFLPPKDSSLPNMLIGSDKH